MPISPDEIQLIPEQQQQLAELAQTEGRCWNEVFADAIRLYRLNCESLPPIDRVPGNGRGKVWMSADFDAPLDLTEMS